MPRPTLLVALALAACTDAPGVDDPSLDHPYAIVGTGQSDCYDTAGNVGCPGPGEPLYGQDAQYAQAGPDYVDNGDGTVSDQVTGLTWQQEQVDPMPWDEAGSYCADLDLGGYTDWRLPSIEEAYSLIDFDGTTGTGAPDSAGAPADAVPFIDESVFDFAWGSPRFIDVQLATTSIYESFVFADNHGLEAGEECFFGVNHADGRIKCYPTSPTHTWQVRCVRGNTAYGVNDFEDGGDGTVTDHATGLQWMQDDSGVGLDWGEALAWCEDNDEAGYTDWRLPTAKELHSLVDYTRSPDTTASAAIDPVFVASVITDLDGDPNYGWYWSSTSHLDGLNPGNAAVYVAFGEATGVDAGHTTRTEMLLDVHGAGAQRSDPKVDPTGAYPAGGYGPQGDVRRVANLARCVRWAD